VTILDDVLTKFDQVIKAGRTDYLVSCPVAFHGQGNGDRRPSLSVAFKNGMVLLHCMAGCHVDDVMVAAGLNWPDLFESSSESSQKIEYIYQRRDGSPYHHVERWQGATGKKINQREAGRVKYGLTQGFKPSLYHLPQLLDAIQHGGEVWIVEGEKCVAAAERLGLVATCPPMGVNGWRDYMAKWFTEGEGASRVHIVVDNDEPGHRFGATVAASIRGVSIPVSTWQIASDDPKADLYDHVIAGLGRDDLRPITLNRLRAEGTTPDCLRTMVFPETRWAVEGVLPTGLAILAGAPKVGKSLVALELALGVACGGLAMSSLKCRPGGVLFLALDNDTEARIWKRMQYIMGDVPEDLPIEIHTEWPIGAEAIAYCQEWVQDSIDQGTDPLLIVVDTLSKMEPNYEGNGHESSYLSSTNRLSRLAKFANDNDLCVLVIHHDRKMGRGEEDGDWMDRILGSRGISATASTCMLIETKRGSDTGWLHLAGRDVGEDDLLLERVGILWKTKDVPRIEELVPKSSN